MGYYANATERIQLIAGLRALATFLEKNVDVPAPRRADVMVFPADGTENEMRAEVDRAAALIGAEVKDDTHDHGHYIASRRFGPIEYRAVLIPARSCEYRDVQIPYADNVIGDGGKEA